MEAIINVLNSNMITILMATLFIVIILLIYSITLKIKLDKLSKRFNECFGQRFSEEDYTLEQILKVTLDESKQTSARAMSLNEKCNILESKVKNCIQKKALLRYNPFDDMGGNLSFVAAFLDEEDNGIVLNGIHSRSGSHTYAKPIEKGKSLYALSREELSAISDAISGYEI